jgi:hypothetical protein
MSIINSETGHPKYEQFTNFCMPRQQSTIGPRVSAKSSGFEIPDNNTSEEFVF